LTKIAQSEEEVAREYRKLLGVDHLIWLDPMTILMKLRHGRHIRGFDFKTVTSGAIAPALAMWDFGAKLISIDDETYAAANRAESHARFTIFHEVVHALGRHKGEFNRLQSRSEIPPYARKLRALESRTDKITAAFIAPRHLICDGWSAREVAFFFGMSAESARIRIEEIRGRARPTKTPPESTADLFRDWNKGPSR
jgi:hypothetical protein